MLHFEESGCQKAMANITDEHLGSAWAPGNSNVSGIDFSADWLQSKDLFLKSELLFVISKTVEQLYAKIQEIIKYTLQMYY